MAPPLCEPGDERTVIAAARELLNIMQYRGLSPNQSVQALIAVSSSFLWATSTADVPRVLHEAMLRKNVNMFCRQIRSRSFGNLDEKKGKKNERGRAQR